MRNAIARLGILIPAWIVAAFFLLQTGCRSAQILPGQWLTVPVAAGGELADFSRKITSHLYENGMMIGVGNDESSLFIFFTPDFRRDRGVPGRATLTLWLDAQGGKARKLALWHRSAPSRPGPRSADAPPAADPPGAPTQELWKVIDRGRGLETFIPADGSRGPAVRLASDWGDYSYQMRVPLRSSGDWPGLAAIPGSDISIGFEWSSEPPAASERGRQGFTGGRPGMGPPRGRGSEMEPGGGMPGERAATKRKVWVKTRLVAK